MPQFQWRPRLFSALGTGFRNDATVSDGVHLRWSLDPRLGLPRASGRAGFDIAYLRRQERSITRVDLFDPPPPYPVRSNRELLPAGMGRIHRAGNELSFLRPLVPSAWTPHWVYLHRRAQLDALLPERSGEATALLDYLDGVMGALGPESPAPLTEQEDAVAVDIRFTPPARQLGVGRTPGAGGAIVARPGTAMRPGRSPSSVGAAGRMPPLSPFRPEVHATVQAFDRCGRLVAEDWVGRHPQRNLAPVGDGAASKPGAVKLEARLRAAGIRTVRIVPQPGHAPLTEDEVRWVFCDEYASARGLWAGVGSEVLETDPALYTAAWLRDDVYGPFHGPAMQSDWADLAARLRTEFLGSSEIQGLLQAGDTFEAWTASATITDLDNPTGASDDTVELPTLSSLLAATVDPVVARLLGLYGYVPPDADIGDRDWRIVAHPPFGRPGNLASLDRRLLDLMDPGQPFFHSPGDSLSNLALAGLVLDARESVKPPPPTLQPDLAAEIQALPAEPDTFENLVISTIEAAPEGVETQPWRVAASFEVIRSLSGEADSNVLDDHDRGPLDDIGLLPDVLVPEFDRETCLATGRLTDVFARGATIDRQLQYVVRGFDIFGRPADPAATPVVDLPAACLPPPPPGSVSAAAIRSGEAVELRIDFDLAGTARVIEAQWQALEVLVHGVPLVDGIAPEQTEWSGARPGRLVELPFDPAALTLQAAAAQHSCMSLAWSAGTLQRQPDTAGACATAFPGPADVADNPAAAVGDPSRRGYRITLSLGARTQYPTGLNGWCARLRLRGVCPTSGRVLHSPEITARATLLLPPPPPQVVQPPLARLPLSTYPDALGTSYYAVDLRDVLSPADQAADTLVTVYLARLEELTDTPAALVDGGVVVDGAGLLALARQSRARFSLVSDPPEPFDPDTPHAAVPVPGELSQTYVVAVLGVNGLLETGRWQDAAFLPFRTPPLRPLPLLAWESAEMSVTASNLRAGFTVSARFPGPMPDPAQPPRLQLFRRDLSAGQRQAAFVATAVGRTDSAAAARPHYVFELADEGAADWRRYEYAIQLLEYAPERDQHIKAGTRVTRLMGAPSTGGREPFAGAGDLTVTAAPGGGFTIEAQLAPGDFAVELAKVPDQGSPVTHRCRIEGGRLYLPPDLQGDFDTGPTCTLRLLDPDPAAGLYRLRLRFRQSLTAAREERTP